MRYLMTVLITLALSSIGFAATIIVPDDYPTIQAAIDAAVNGDTVLVEPGTYSENVHIAGKAIWVKSSQGPAVTVIDGNRSGSVVRIQPVKKFTILDGFTLMNGSGTWEGSSGGWVGSGGGIYCVGYGDGPQIWNNIIRDNLIEDYDPGFYNYSHGAGVFCKICSAFLYNNIFLNNVGVTSNGDSGGGIYFWESASLLVNNTFCRNQSDSGGAMMCLLTSSPTVVNSIFWDNMAPQGPEIHVGYGGTTPSTLTISHSDVKGGKASVYVEAGSTLNWGAGMLDADPLFADPAIGDFHLTFPSPCKDTGDNTAVTVPYDFEGDPRIAYGTVDMGADEFYTHLYWTGNATPGGNVALKFVGLPGTSPVQLWLGSGVLDPPWTTKYGDWHLQFPLLANLALGSIPTPEGVLVLPFTFPPDTTTPLSLPFQAGIGLELTNLSLMEVK